jgi:cytochrome b561
MLISGPIIVWTKGFAINIFGLLNLPSPFGKIDTLNEIFGLRHKIGAKMLLFAFSLHLLSVIKHILVDRENVLKKMLKPIKE